MIHWSASFSPPTFVFLAGAAFAGAAADKQDGMATTETGSLQALSLTNFRRASTRKHAAPLGTMHPSIECRPRLLPRCVRGAAACSARPECRNEPPPKLP